jgi:hypothetical protein
VVGTASEKFRAGTGETGDARPAKITTQKWSHPCELLLRARLVPDRAGADTQAVVHIPLSALRQLPGARELEDAWIRARLGEDGFLADKDAEVAACDAQTVPVVTGTMNPGVIDQMIGLARSAAEAGAGAPAAGVAGVTAAPDAAGAAQPGERTRSWQLSPEAWRALRHAMARLAVDLVSGPHGIAAVLRHGLLDKPFTTPSLPLDIGYSHTIPGHIRRAVQLRDRHCAWPPLRPARRVLRHPSLATQSRRRRHLAGEPDDGLQVPPRRLHPPAGDGS